MPASQYLGPRETQLPHLIGIFLLSLATLLLELALTRVLSVTLWYHFGFLVISTALLGFGVSGVTLALWRRLRENDDLDGCLSLCSLAFSGTTVVAFWLMQHVPFDPFSIAVDRRQWIIMPAYFLLVAIPFFCSGLAISLLLTRTSHDVARLYACDLLGAGAGCALVTVLLPRLGGSGSVLAAASLGSLASLCFALRSRRLLVASSALVAFVLVIASTQADRLLPIHISANKLTRPLHPLYTAWNTLSRVDVEESAAQGDRPAERRMIIDAGTAATGLQDLRPGVRDILQNHPETIDDSSSIVYIAHPAARVLIIGSGGGAQVLEALKQGSPSITAVEINPTINDIVAHRMDDFWGGLFHQPEVHLVTDEGRSFLRRSPDRYDAIISVHTISNAAVASGALSLAENYVLTREAFDDYLDHLAPGGIIFFTRPEAQIARLVATARESFAARHLGSIASNVFAYTQRSTNSRTLSGRVQDGARASFSAGFLLQNTPFTSTQLNQIRETLTAQNKAENSETKVLYAPDAPRELPLSLYQGIVSAPDLQAIYNTNDTQLAPATDDKPFFNQHTR